MTKRKFMTEVFSRLLGRQPVLAPDDYEGLTLEEKQRVYGKLRTAGGHERLTPTEVLYLFTLVYDDIS